MTARANRFRQMDVTRALRGARAAGYDDVRVVLGPDGTMSILTGKLAENGARNSFDELMQ